jgi:hypothetical protein
MELKDLRKLPMPKLRDLAKQETELQGVGGMEKEDLIKAIAAAKGIAYDESSKDLNAIHSVKADIRRLKKEKTEAIASGGERRKIKSLKRKVKLLKRLTRHLAREKKTAKSAEAAPAA